MKLSTFCIFLFLLLNACTPKWIEPKLTTRDEVATLYVCVDLPEEQQEDAKKAIGTWNRALHRWKNLEYVKNSSTHCSYWIHEVEIKNPKDTSAAAWTSSLGGNEISMRKGWYEYDTTGIIMHELGHAFGAQHLPGTLMNPYWFKHGFICPDMTTVAQVAAWNKINLSLLSWCSI
jgi:hypothetical protein